MKTFKPVCFFIGSVLFLSSVSTIADTIIIKENDDPVAREIARQKGVKWQENKTLRDKINNRAEKEYDKFDKAIDDADACQKSLNINVYWEPKTRRCLDTRTGHPATP